MRESESDTSLIKKSPYDFLISYAYQSKIKSKAYSYSEKHYRLLHKQLTYPMILFTSVSTVISVLEMNKYALIGLNLSMLVLVGFNQAINPKDKEHSAHNISIEMGELSSNIKQFVNINNRTKSEIKAYTELIHEQITIWDGLSPPIKEEFITKATNIYAKRSRKSRKPGKIELDVVVS